MLNNNPDKYNSWTFREETPDGTGWIIIMEESPGVVYKIDFWIGKGGTSLNSYCRAIAELCNLHLDSGGTVSDLIEKLFDIVSDQAIRLRSGPNEPINRSGAEAVASALRQYIQSLPNDILEQQGERRLSKLLKNV